MMTFQNEARRLAVISVAAAIAILTAMVYTARTCSTVPARTDPQKRTVVRTAKSSEETNVSLTGIVKETTDTTIVVERTVKDKKETLEFTLDKAVEKIKAGDKVKVSYIKKEDKYIAKQVVLVLSKMPPKKYLRTNAVKQEAH